MHCVSQEFLVKKDSKFVTQARTLFKTFKIRYRINWIENTNKDLPCTARVKKNFVILNIYPGYDTNTFCSIVCHEIIHILDYRFGLFKRVYSIDTPKDRREFNWFKKNALIVELDTDKRAKYLCKLYFPEIKYYKGYNKSGIRYFEDVYIKAIEKEMLRKKKRR